MALLVNKFREFVNLINRQSPKIRTDPYVIQIGFDFGTSYSKCIYRNLNNNRAFVFTYDKDGTEEFLLSSTIIYNHTRHTFSINYQNHQYPPQGLWHLKMAIDDLAKKKYASPTLTPFNQAAGLQPGSSQQRDFIMASGVFYLSRALHRIRRSILAHFQDFGKNERDDMYVTMGIPVSDLEDKATENIFQEILEISWAIACENASLKDQASYQEMTAALKEKLSSQRDICHVYPEVSANIQVFKKSPSFPGKSRRIYFVSDTGAGTVDQCCFTYFSDTDNYLSARVFELGSRCIEHKCFQRMGGSIEEWRQRKERQEIDQRMKSILIEMAGELTYTTRGKTLAQLVKRLHISRAHGINPHESIKKHAYLIFSGGGDMEIPYHHGVVQALSRIGKPPRSEWEDRIIHLEAPQDVEFPEDAQREKWMKRLYVAYGLSFIYDDLSAVKFPAETMIYDDRQTRVCPRCQGRNPHCEYCNGFYNI